LQHEALAVVRAVNTYFTVVITAVTKSI